jgi:O-acetyl-ADP-ribose deacetylase
MKKTLFGVDIDCVRGDITDQPEFTAIVNAANPQLRTGGGVAGAIHRAAGPGLEEEARRQAPIRPGEAVITDAHGLPNRFVIHCLGPVYGVDSPADKLLGDCYKNALRLAEVHQVDSIAFPAISTGSFGYPMEEAAEVAFRAIYQVLPELHTVRRIRFVLFDRTDLETHMRVLARLSAPEE